MVAGKNATVTVTMRPYLKTGVMMDIRLGMNASEARKIVAAIFFVKDNNILSTDQGFTVRDIY